MSDHDLSHHGIDEVSGGNYPNDTIRLLVERSSCRSFSDRKIPDDILNLILECGIHSPTGGNLQPYSIIAVENQETKDRLTELCGNQDFISTAPVNLLFCIDWHRLEGWAKMEIAPFSARHAFRHFWISFQDTIIAAQNICTAADALGLGSVYVGTVMESLPEVRELLALPDGVMPVVLLSLGYPKVRPSPKKKLGIDIVVHREKYTELPDDKLRQAFEKKYPGWKKEINPERLATIEQVCRGIHGADFAAQCLNRIREQGFISAAQNYFGLHYRADLMPENNEQFVETTKIFGFNWFKKVQLPLKSR